ncbi:MAG TPA: peptidoglycan-binding protein [Verrucomicrobiae bacterium]|nr:peptidoglycan-binding protein [Verrucomicrobiae bacterium]
MTDKTVGSGNYEVQPGDCLASIAAEHGFHWETLWNLPENAELKSVRKDPYVLFPGDLVYIPELRVERPPRPTDQKHQFVLNGVPEKLYLVITDEQDRPLANQPYVLVIDKVHRFTGNTDGAGAIRQPIEPNAQRGHLTVGPAGNEQEYHLGLGQLDPIDTITGLQARLFNLGFYPGEIDGIAGPQTETAVMLFQDTHYLEANGEYDDDTQTKLKQVYGS